MPSACKFYPSCSHYAAEAVQVHGARRGSWLALRRVSRCHPFTRGGVDLVPDAAESFARLSGTGFSLRIFGLARSKPQAEARATQTFRKLERGSFLSERKEMSTEMRSLLAAVLCLIVIAGWSHVLQAAAAAMPPAKLPPSPLQALLRRLRELRPLPLPPSQLRGKPPLPPLP